MDDLDVWWRQKRVSGADRRFEQMIFSVIICQGWESLMLLTSVQGDAASGMRRYSLGGTPCLGSA
jgi:hypothetical protein